MLERNNIYTMEILLKKRSTQNKQAQKEVPVEGACYKVPVIEAKKNPKPAPLPVLSQPPPLLSGLRYTETEYRVSNGFMGHAGALGRAHLLDLVPGACWGGGGPPPDHLRGAPRRLDCRGSSGAALTAMLLGVGGGGWRGPSLRRAPRASRADPEQGVQEQVDKFEKTISVAVLYEVEIGKMRNQTSTARNQANTLAGRKNNEVLFSEIQIQLRCQKYTVDVKATSDSKVNDELFWQKEELEKYKEEAQANKSYMLQTITVAVTKKNTVLFSKIHSQLKGQKYTVDVKATSDSKVITTVTVNELYTPTPGLKGIISIPTPYQKSSTGKVELQYLHSRAGINASVGLNANPLVNFSGVLGTKAIAFGVDAAFDTALGNFTKYNAGVSHTNQDFTASLNLNNKRDTLAASYYHQVHGTAAVREEIADTLLSNENIITIGSQSQHELDPPDHRQGALQQVRHLLQHAWRPSPSSPSQLRSTPRPSRRAPS